MLYRSATGWTEAYDASTAEEGGVTRHVHMAEEIWSSNFIRNDGPS